MLIPRRTLMAILVVGASLALTGSWAEAQDRAQRYVRFEHQSRVSYGRLDGETIHELRGSIFESAAKTGQTYALRDVKLLVPCEPSKVLAVGRNYGSHIGDVPKPANPELFFKSASSLLDPGGEIVIPPGTEDCHYEAEMVIVIGKKAKNVSVEDAGEYVFGVTCGNDVSARDWQLNDMQWWRAKASDTFAPAGPWIVVGVDYDDLLLTARLNGEVKQQQRTSDLIFNVHEVVSFTSRYVTLLPGDMIYTGTPGQTSAMKSGDVVEIEIEGIGVLRNRVQ